MRRYDDPVEVRRGPVAGGPGPGDGVVEEAPQQFLWRERLWQVRAVVAHWVETGPWWHSPGVRAVVGSDEPSEQAVAGAVPSPGGVATLTGSGDLLREHEVWRVEAARPGRTGVFDLVLDWTTGSWRLTGSVD